VLLAAGTLGRALVAVTTVGQPFDVESFYVVRDALAEEGLAAYSQVFHRWPYPPGFLPFVLLSDVVAGWTHIEFHDVVQAPAIAADAGIAWLVQSWLGRRGAVERVRLVAVAAVMLGPAFAVISGYHTQIDSVAILPAMVGVFVWTERPDDPRRWLWVGLLIGAGAAIKTTPGLMLLAVLPTAWSLREGLKTAVATAVVPALASVPFLVADPNGLPRILEYQGVPGAGGLTMMLDPGLLSFWLPESGVPRPELFDANGLVDGIREHSGVLTAALLAGVGAFVAWARVDAVRSAVLIWLALYAFGPGFFFQYLVWGLPFFLVAGYIKHTILLQAALVVPFVLVYGKIGGEAPQAVYLVFMGAVWAATAVAFVLLGRQLVRARPRPAV
jgi:hypothetical protein